MCVNYECKKKKNITPTIVSCAVYDPVQVLKVFFNGLRRVLVNERQVTIVVRVRCAIQFWKGYNLYDVEALAGAVCQVGVYVGGVETCSQLPSGVSLP